MEAGAMASQLTLEHFRYRISTERGTSFFAGQGFGPFVVERRSLRDKILTSANPYRSYHISGCKGAGKTTLLKLIGEDIIGEKKSVYFFKNSNDIDLVRMDIESMMDKKEEAYFLIDETQANANSSVFTFLLKNDTHHKITTIGAGVPAFQSLSSSFAREIKINDLILTEQDLTTRISGPESE
uniref:Uncharacterized protein n=1 Tax=Entomoneis paludosa TaxID=265537 RepID=A0A6U2Z3U9_9STRA|mmetsp:Transcript_18464/g.38158  ORF Transcript_18464/g.38158 Transcript_18464/m.38158 type:complete len:183 (+) Transcript_18464:68-616(+)